MGGDRLGIPLAENGREVAHDGGCQPRVVGEARRQQGLLVAQFRRSGYRRLLIENGALEAVGDEDRIEA